MTTQGSPLGLTDWRRLPSSWAVDDRHLIVRATAAHAEAVAGYHARNEAHLSPWDVSWNAARCDVDWQTRQLQEWDEAWVYGSMTMGDKKPSRPVDHWAGFIAHQACTPKDPSPAAAAANGTTGLHILGWIEWSAHTHALTQTLSVQVSYSLDRSHQSQGLMFSALTSLWAALNESVSGRVRLLAHVRQDNGRSRRLLSRLGFSDLGPDGDFPALLVQGAWLRHHLYEKALDRTRG